MLNRFSKIPRYISFFIIECHLPNSHCYADDSQIYLSFKRYDFSSQQDAITATQNCIDRGTTFAHGRNTTNSFSTMKRRNFSSLAHGNSYLKLNTSSITVENSAIMKSSVVRNLGSYIDDKLSINSHINKVCNASFYYLYNIGRIRKHLSRDSSETLIHAFVSTRSIRLL